VYEAFENAGETFEIAGSRTGVYVGNFAFDHLLTQSRDWESPRPYAATGVDTCILANRVSYIFDLHGPRQVNYSVESIHATARMDGTLAYCRSLLKPGGKLVLVESTEMKVLPCLLFGTLTGFWAGANDHRSEGPFLDEQNWDSRLRKSGFSGADLVLHDYPRPHNMTSVVVSTRVEEAREPDAAAAAAAAGADVVHLLHDGDDAPALLTQVAAELQQRGTKSVVFSVDTALNTVSANAHVVAFLSTNDGFCTKENRLNTSAGLGGGLL
jgi:hypothetical protein